MSIFLLDTTSAPIPKSVPDLSVLPPFRLHAAANRGREKEMLTRSMIAYQRAIKPLSQTLIRETGKLQNQQAEFVGKLEDLKNGLVQAERKLKLQMRSGGNIGEAYREKLEVLAAIKELKERHGHVVERGRQRQQHQRQAMVEYREHLNQCKHQLVRNSEQLASRRNLSISFDNSDDEDEAKLLGRPVPTMERMRREGAESPTEILLQDLKLEEKNVLDSIRDRERLAQILRVEGISNLQPQLSNCGITTAQDLASMSVHQIYSLPFTKPEKNILQSSARTARELRGLPASESSRHGAAAMLTSRAYDASFSHRAPVYEDHDSTIRKKMEEAVRGRSEPELLALVRGPHGHECVRQADQDGWTLLHRACIPNQPKTSKPKSPLRVFTPSSSEMQHRGIALPFSSPRKPSTPSVQSLKSPGKARSPRSSIQGLLSEGTMRSQQQSEVMVESGNMVRLLLAAQADVHAQNKYERTPLHYAAMEGNYVAALMLLKAGAAPDHVDAHGMTPAQHCILMRKGAWEQLSQYFERIADPEPADQAALKSARAKSSKGKGKSGKGKKSRTVDEK